MKEIIVALFGVVLLSGCEDSNSEPTYGETGLPKIAEQSSKPTLKNIKRFADIQTTS